MRTDMGAWAVRLEESLASQGISSSVTLDDAPGGDGLRVNVGTGRCLRVVEHARWADIGFMYRPARGAPWQHFDTEDELREAVVAYVRDS